MATLFIDVWRPLEVSKLTAAITRKYILSSLVARAEGKQSLKVGLFRGFLDLIGFYLYLLIIFWFVCDARREADSSEWLNLTLSSFVVL